MAGKIKRSLAMVALKLAAFIPGEIGEKARIKEKRLRISRDRQIDILRNFSNLLSEGGKVRSILTILEREYLKAHGPDHAEVKFFRSALSSIKAGISLDEAMREWFDPDLSQVMRATFSAKNGAGALDSLLSQVERWEAVSKKIRSALKTPLIVIIGSSVFTMVISVWGIDMLAGDTPKEHWTEIAIAYANFGDWLEDNNKYVLLMFAWLVGIYFYALFAIDGERRVVLDKYVPGFSFYQASQASRFFSVMSVLVSPQGGAMHLKRALSEFEENTDLISSYLEEHVQIMLDRCQRGEFNYEQLNTGLLPPNLQVRLGVAASSSKGLTLAGAFENISKHLADDYGQLLINRVSNSMNYILFASLMLTVMGISAALDGVFSRLEAVMF